MQETPEEVIDECIARLSREVPLKELGHILANMAGVIWTRTSRTLSEITLTTIFERALYASKDKFPILSSFTIDHSKKPVTVIFERPNEAINNLELIQAFRLFLINIINLVGNLTSNILLNSLYHELRSYLLLPLDQLDLLDRQLEQLDKQIESKNMKSKTQYSKGIPPISRIKTHISNLDEILGGGLPEGSITIIAGPPGTGKTILSEQICFENATAENRVLFFQTLSEPTAKTLKYVSQFNFFDPKKIEDGPVEFVDLGAILKSKTVQEGIDLMMEHVKRVKPAFVVIDSFKVFEDLSTTKEELRKFSYGLAVSLMVWECTTLLLGEFSSEDLDTSPLISIVDGLIKLKLEQVSGERQRFIRIVKMRGTDHNREEHVMSITRDGVGIFAPEITIRRKQDEKHEENFKDKKIKRARLGISNLDDLLGEGVPLGSSFLLSGVAGTGKTLLSLEFIYKGAMEFKEKGIYFSFEETEERLLAAARGMGWKMDELIQSRMIEIVFIAQTDIVVEKHLLMMNERIQTFGAKRIAIDSVSLFVHKVDDPKIVREKIFQLATLVQRARGVGFFVTDIPYGTNQLSRFGVEETVIDGVILLTSSEKGFERERFIEIYKLRNTAHANGRHKLEITGEGIHISPRKFIRPSKETLPGERNDYDNEFKDTLH